MVCGEPVAVGDNAPRSTELSCLEEVNEALVDERLGQFHEVRPFDEGHLRRIGVGVGVLDADVVEEHHEVELSFKPLVEFVAIAKLFY